MAAGCTGGPQTKFIAIISVLAVTLHASDTIDEQRIFEQDVVTPYTNGQHGPKHGHRVTRECQGVMYGNVTHESFLSHTAPDVWQPLVETNRFIDKWDITERLSKLVYGHISYVNNPLRTLSVLEPREVGGCAKSLRATVEETALQKHCLVAVNAGFFNTHTGACLGNIVSDGRMVLQNKGIQNAHFGIRQDGTLFFGYLSDADLKSEENPFIQLVGGVGWIIRNGENYLEKSKEIECSDTEETGTVDQFFQVVSARTVVGHDLTGKVVLLQVDGKTWEKGANLPELANFLLKLGIINAINLDGGGSATYVINGTTVNYPTDMCSHNCSGKGNCTEDGCVCDPGWIGSDCKQQCPEGTYGIQCRENCKCEQGRCNFMNGHCSCHPGYTGHICDRVCPYGYYGDKCQQQCQCGETSCTCHPINGSCDVSQLEYFDSGLFYASKCMANEIIYRRHLLPPVPLKQNYFFIGFCVCSILLFISLVGNFFFMCHRCTCTYSSRPTAVYHSLTSDIPGESEELEEIKLNEVR
ncbi:N-acetylglucosamine-1-phosphodiester alpha-N-acetylglucosaminidase-like isoform X2 [Ptychodera flava]|uniref:N-acetylglucosamine-1-phosphodiester alpha-N-acetylglucosaminidase-like isoform X2 n=1 Tax=Ptychodera flava TaxID=63121 RepID=UPI00396A3C11